jgi:hypothetical protein
MQCLEYAESTNAWSICSKPSGIADGHGYDHNAVDPATGFHYIRQYLVNQYWVWNGSTWAQIARNSCEPPADEPAVGLTWSTRLGGLVSFSDSSGVCLWRKSTNTWSSLGKPQGIQGSYHFVVEDNPAAGMVWIQDGNDTSNHWRIDGAGKISQLATPPVTLGCCGKNGRFSAYDDASEKFIVAAANEWYEYDIVADSWKKLPLLLPLYDSQIRAGTFEGFVTTITRHRVLMYVVARETGESPVAYIYKHK